VNVQFKKGVLELLVLAVVAESDCYGYELVERISRCIDIAEGTIYPLLRRLQSEGYFETYLKESASGPPRKYYRLTPQGRIACARMRSEWEDFVGGVDRLLNHQKNDKHAKHNLRDHHDDETGRGQRRVSSRAGAATE
jgi:PadR family transcriptional regulator PadR